MILYIHLNGYYDIWKSGKEIRMGCFPWTQKYYRVRPAWHLHIARTQHSRTLQLYLFFWFFQRDNFYDYLLRCGWEIHIFKYTISVIYSCIHYPTVLNFWRKFHSQIYGGWHFTRLWNFLPLLTTVLSTCCIIF